MQNNEIILDHGSGGKLSHELVSDVIAPILGDVYLGEMEDSFTGEIESNSIAITTDSFVIDPIFFGNGNIGTVSICGTVNDIAVSGAIIKYITLALVLEVGLAIPQLKEVLLEIRKKSIEAGIKIVAGDTKVVRKGDVDKIFINTTGIGYFPKGQEPLKLKDIREGDDIIITNEIGNHAIHILSIREGLGYENRILSDSAPLNKIIQKVLNKFRNEIHFMRDVTRGGLGSSLNEISESIKKTIFVDMESIPIKAETQMACDMLGISPLYLANEGTVIVFCKPSITTSLLEEIKKDKNGLNAKVIGKVGKELKELSEVIGRNNDNSEVIIEVLTGAELPRLC